MTKQQELEALQNALDHLGLTGRHIVNADARLGKRYAIGEEVNGVLRIHSEFLTYRELNQYIRGYNAGRNAR